MPRYMLLLRESTTGASELGPEEIQAIVGRYMAWSESMRARGKLLGGEKLRDAPGRVLARAGEELVVRDGPYAETKEVVGGYFLMEAADLAEAEALCRDCPHLEYGGAIELREVEEV